MTPTPQQGPSNGLGSSQPTRQTPPDILLIIFIHGYCDQFTRGSSLVTPFLTVSKEMTRHLETFLRDYSISSRKQCKIR